GVERRAMAVDAGHAPGQFDAASAEGGEIDVAVVGTPDQLQRRFAAGRDRVGQLVDGAVEGPDALQPPEDVHAAVAPWQTAVAADGQHDVAAGPGPLGRGVDGG